MGDIGEKIRRWDRELPISRNNVILLVCIPTAQWRFWLQSVPLKPLWKATGIWSDYASEQKGDYWKKYGERIGGFLRQIEGLGVRVVRDARFDDFRAAIERVGESHRLTPRGEDPREWALFVVGHQPEGEGSPSGIEFADSLVSIEEIAKAIAGRCDGPLTINLNVCDSFKWAAELSELVWQGQVGNFADKTSLPRSLEFTYYWLRDLNGRRTLAESWLRAIDVYTGKELA